MVKPEDEIRIIQPNGQIITAKLTDEIRTFNFQGHIVTAKITEAITAHLGTSINKDVAVAMLLGLLKGPKYPIIMMLAPNGLTLDLLYQLQDKEGSLQEMLSLWRNVASEEYATSKEEKTPEVLKEKEEVATNAASLHEKAFIYMMDIDEELLKGDDSVIKIDPQKTEETGVTQLTLRSFDRWARKVRDISILDDQGQNISTENIQAQPTTQEKVEGRDSKGGLSKTRADNLFTTFAFLYEDLAKHLARTAPKKYGAGNPNKESIATYIHGLAKKANNDVELSGQSHEAIKDRIEEAMEIKKPKLPQK